MADTHFTISPAGFLVEYNVATPVLGDGIPSLRGGGLDAPTVSIPLPGQLFSAKGRGTFPLDGRISGRQGTIEVDVVLGAVGTARTILYLTDSLTSPSTHYIYLGIDALNRPVAAIKDILGNVVAHTLPSFGTNLQGKTLTIRLVWDSVNPFLLGWHISLSIGGSLNSFPYAPSSAWTHFQPTYLVLGASLGDADFNGTILGSRLSNEYTAPPAASPDVVEVFETVSAQVDTVTGTNAGPVTGTGAEMTSAQTDASAGSVSISGTVAESVTAQADDSTGTVV